jgi:hypothetical protein
MPARGRKAPQPSRDGHTVTTAANGAPPAEGRDPATGQFAPGNGSGQGNPHARGLAALRAAFTESCTPEQVRALALRLHKQAMTGDVLAARLWLGYALGRPAEQTNPDTLDLAEARLAQSWPHDVEVMLAIMRGIRPALAAEVLRALSENQTPVSIGKKISRDDDDGGLRRLIDFEAAAQAARAKRS